jgi:metallo-beta-lactamase family protein
VAKGGVLIMPAFAVGRVQTILYCLYELKQKKVIPNIPIFLDSPMAISVTDLFCKFKDEHKLPAGVCTDIFAVATYTRSVEESKHIDNLTGSSIIIAGSGMANGGRVRDHFTHFISDAKNTILFVGFQAKGTDGRDLVDGAKEIKIYGRVYEVHAAIKTIDTLSAHADYKEILQWLGYFETAPKKVFITHGELAAAQSLKQKIEKQFGWSVVIPKYLESFDLE